MESNRERFFEIYEERLDRQPREKIADSEILMCFNGAENSIQTVSSISRKTDLSGSAVRKRLKELEEKNLLSRRRVMSVDVWTLRLTSTAPWSDRFMEHLERRIEEKD